MGVTRACQRQSCLRIFAALSLLRRYDAIAPKFARVALVASGRELPASTPLAAAGSPGRSEAEPLCIVPADEIGRSGIAGIGPKSEEEGVDPAEAERYWYNEICNTAQWGHPIDELVRSLLKMHRNPRHAQVELMRNPSLARTGPTILGTEGASTRALESVVHAP